MTTRLRLIFSMTIAVALIFGAAGSSHAEWFFQNPLAGKKAPAFTLLTVKGSEQSLESIAAGKKTILFFWATWCPHCREQIATLQEKKAELAKNGIVIALVDINEPRHVVQRFLEAQKLDYLTFLDTDASVAESYQVVGVPTMIFIGSDGKIRDSENVFPDNYLEVLK